MRPNEDRARRVRFGEFELDRAAHEVWRDGERIKLQDQPWEVLCALLDRPGELVSRDELRARLWPEGTFVEFDQSLNKAIARLRECLEDEVERPRYIETVPRKGYRLVASVAQVPEGRSRRRVEAFMATALFAAIFTTGLWPLTMPRVESVTRLTFDGQPKQDMLVVAEGKVAYAAGNNLACGSEIRTIPTNGGASRPVIDHLPGTGEDHCFSLWGYSSLTRQMLVETGVFGANRSDLWFTTVDGKDPTRVGDARSPAAFWLSPDARGICVVSPQGLFWRDFGTQASPRQLFREYPVDCYWHPFDGRLAFGHADKEWRELAVYEWSPSSGKTERALPEFKGPHANPVYSHDGKRMFFKSKDEIWVAVRPGFLGWMRGAVIRQLTTGGVFRFRAHPDPEDSSRLYTMNTTYRGEVFRFDGRSRNWTPLHVNPLGGDFQFSPDGMRIAFVHQPSRELYVSGPLGQDEVRVLPGIQVQSPRWSPNGEEVAFCEPQNIRRCQLGIVNTRTSRKTSVATIPDMGCAPTWSPDGRRIAVSTTYDDPDNLRILIVDLESQSVGVLPGSEGKACPAWSPDGKSIVAQVASTGIAWLFTIESQQWKEVLARPVFSLGWSRDGKRILGRFNDRSVVRIDPASRNHEIVAEVRDFTPVADYLSWTPDGEPIVNRDLTTYDIYRINLTR